jgi:hypothetical protein
VKLTPAAKALRIVPFEKLKSSKAWKLTSLLVRLSSGGYCYTCEKKYPMEKLVAGHYIEKRGHAAIYFDLDCLRAQCSWSCNRQNGGMKDVYARKLVKEKGPEILEILFKRSQKSKVWTLAELEEIAEQRGELLNTLKENRDDYEKTYQRLTAK